MVATFEQSAELAATVFGRTARARRPRRATRSLDEFSDHHVGAKLTRWFGDDRRAAGTLFLCGAQASKINNVGGAEYSFQIFIPLSKLAIFSDIGEIELLTHCTKQQLERISLRATPEKEVRFGRKAPSSPYYGEAPVTRAARARGPRRRPRRASFQINGYSRQGPCANRFRIIRTHPAQGLAVSVKGSGRTAQTLVTYPVFSALSSARQ